ncbi:FAD-binding oxidoreductase [Candidatus Saccharibacteria bacterium]|nr:FAD-binding oxidoreductase [Candidatus Saccharibacteria bacterium]
MNRIAIYLNQHIDGVVYSAPEILKQYATDRSILKFHPRIVALPVNTTDIARLVKFSNQLAQKKVALPITVRGSGNSKTGASIGTGLLISTEKLNRIQEIDERQRLIRVQAGIRLGELQKALSTHGLALPVLGHPMQSIGSLIAEQARASVNTEARTIVDFVERAEIVLSDGTRLETDQYNTKALKKKLASLRNEKDIPFEAKIYQGIDKLLDEHKKLLEKMPPAAIDKSGYSGITSVLKRPNAKRQMRARFDIAPLFCGSEGTLGIITEVILRVEPVFDEPNYVVVPCPTVKSLFNLSKLLLSLNFTDIVFYDAQVFNAAAKTGKSSKFFKKIPEKAYLLVANTKDDSTWQRRRKLRQLKAKLDGKAHPIEISKTNYRDFLALQANLDAFLNDTTANAYYLPILDGAYVPLEKQTEFLTKLAELLTELKVEAAIYGSIDFQTINVRPAATLNTANGRKTLILLIRRYLKLLQECGGNPYGAAPEGRFLAIFTKAEAKTELLALQGEIKKLFDPNDILNPGLKQEAETKTILGHFRTDYDSGLLSSE